MKSKNSKSKSFLLLLINCIIPFFYGVEDFSQTDAINVYFISTILCVIYLYPTIKEKGLVVILSPSILSFFYIALNNIVGGLYMRAGWILDSDLLSTFDTIPSKSLFFYAAVNSFFNSVLCLIGVYRSRGLFVIKGVSGSDIGTGNSVGINRRIVALVLLLLLISLVPLSFDEESRSYGGVLLTLYFPFYISTVICLYYNILQKRYSSTVNLLVALFLFVISAVILFHSKREAFFCLIAMVIMIAADNGLVIIKAKHLLLGGLIGVLSVVLILSSSLMRGYSGFDGDSYLEAVKAVPAYVDSPTFWAATGSNFEVVSSYPHTVNAFHYINNGQIPTLYGETFWKVLFVPIPESLFGYKPRKMLEIYTEIYDSSFRDRGGSYPVMCYADFMANFKILSVFFLLIFFSFFDRLYYSAISLFYQRKKTVNTLLVIALSSIFLMFTRGAGFSSLCIYVVLSWVTMKAYKSLKLI